jgi:hypothetical protein
MTAQIIPVDPDNARTLARHATETTSTCQIQELRTARLRHLRGSGAGFSGRRLDENNVKSLMESMGEHGFWKSSPLRVRPIKIRELNDGNIDGWEIISGQHRFEAAWRLNYATVPCVIAASTRTYAAPILNRSRWLGKPRGGKLFTKSCTQGRGTEAIGNHQIVKFPT